MNKRNVSAVLWFFAGWTAGSMLSVLGGMSPFLSPILAVGIAAFIWWDPTGQVWQTDGARARRQRVADLPRVGESQPEVELQREADTARG